MHKLIKIKNTLKLFFTLIILISSIGLIASPVIAGKDEDRLEELQRQLAEIRKQQQDLNSQIEQEKNKVNQYGDEVIALNQEIRKLQLIVQEKQLVIDELDLKINILNNQIEETIEKISKTEKNITKLEEETDQRLANMYLDIKSFNNSISMVFASDGTSDFIKDGLYREALQEETNEKLEKLAREKENLKKDKKQLEQDKVQIEEDKELLEQEKVALESNKTVLAQKRNKFEQLKRNAATAAQAMEVEYNNLSDEEKRLQAELELLKQRIFNQVGSIPNGTFVLAGTIIGYEGNTGVSTGAHLHFGVKLNGQWNNPCSLLPYKQLANTTCGTSSNQIPEWPEHGTPWLTSGYRTSYRPNHNAIDISSGGDVPIYATHDGWITYGNDGACSWYNGIYPCHGAGANYAIICEDKNNCNNGLKTLYWHLK